MPANQLGYIGRQDYVGGGREARLADAGWRMFVQPKGGKEKPLLRGKRERRNRRIAGIRARFMHVSAGIA